VRAARRFFQQAIGATKVTPTEVTTDRAPVYPDVLEVLLEAAWHRADQDANNRVEGTVALSRDARGKPSKVEALLHGRPPRRARTTRPCL
jgi:transposase-like protein